jgi:hypothetical protein
MPVKRTITTNATIAANNKIKTIIVCRIHDIEADSIFPLQYAKLRISRPMEFRCRPRQFDHHTGNAKSRLSPLPKKIALQGGKSFHLLVSAGQYLVNGHQTEIKQPIRKNRKTVKQILLRLASAFAFITLVVCCAHTQQTENLLSAAGFRIIIDTTTK